MAIRGMVRRVHEFVRSVHLVHDGGEVSHGNVRANLDFVSHAGRIGNCRFHAVGNQQEQRGNEHLQLRHGHFRQCGGDTCNRVALLRLDRVVHRFVVAVFLVDDPGPDGDGHIREDLDSVAHSRWSGNRLCQRQRFQHLHEQLQQDRIEHL